MDTPAQLHRDQPAAYRIAFQGRVQANWTDWLQELAVHTPPDQPAVTVLTGIVADQAALFGLLARLRDLGLPLLLVQYLPAADRAA